MKKLCVILFASQIMIAEPRASVVLEDNNIFQSETVRMPGDRNIQGAGKGTKTSTTKRVNKVSFELTPEQESRSRMPYAEQKKVRRINRLVTDKNESEQTQDQQEEAQRKAKERSKSQAAKKGNARELITELSADQQAKNKAIKKGLTELQNDRVVVGVFKKIGVHTDFENIMNNLGKKADKEVTQDDLNSVQNFLKNIVAQKIELQKINSKVLNEFLMKIKTIVEQNFSNLSVSEMGQFFNQVATMKKEALSSESKTVSKKSNSTSSDSFSRAPKHEGRKHFGKGSMPSGEGKTGPLGIIFGLAFAAAIFVLVQDLANQA